MIDGLFSLVFAGIAFCGSHVLLSSTSLRGSLRDQLGERGFLAVYSLTALVTFAWFLVAYAHAPTIILWSRNGWTSLVPVTVMPLAAILLIAGYTTPNPTAVGMERSARANDPAPGILRVTRHPVMWAIGLWAISHVIANGDLRSLLFFGAFAVLSLGGTILIDRKKQLALGSNWSRLAEVTSNLPFAALLTGRTGLRWRDIGFLRIAAGLLLYVVLYRGHAIIAGIPVVIPLTPSPPAPGRDKLGWVHPRPFHRRTSMLLPLQGRRLYYDIAGPENGPVVCITHSLASDGGSWAEQVPPLLQAGFRVLRLDMRGHGGSDPVAGNYTMQELAGDVAIVLEALAIPRMHYIGLSIGGMIGQAFALEHGAKLISALWSDTLPASPAGAAALWDERMNTVRRANSLEPLADATVERWFTDAFKPRKPGRWKEIRDTVAATTAAGYLGCSAAIMSFDFTARLPGLRIPTLVVCGAEDPGTPPSENRRLAALVPGGRYEEIANARHFPNVEHPNTFNRIMMSWLEAQRHAP